MAAEEKYTSTIDGVIMSVRRSKRRQPWQTLLGKTIPIRYPLVNHLTDTMAVAEALYVHYLSDKQKTALYQGVTIEGDSNGSDYVLFLIKLAAGLHDIGKATPDWQRHTLKLPAGDESLQDLTYSETINHDSGRWKHEINGGLYFHNNPQTQTSASQIANAVIKQMLLETTSGHHGDFKVDEVISRSVKGEPQNLDWLTQQQLIEEHILQTCGIKLQELDAVTMVDEFSTILITGLVVLSDWIASQTEFILNRANSDDESYAAAYEAAIKEITRLGLEKPTWAKDLGWDSIFPHISTPNALQSSLIDNIDFIKNAGITLISAPMGMGKTESALYLASMIGSEHSNNGFWITLPTQATANALFSRAVEISDKVFLDKQTSVSLMHGNSLIAEAIEGIPRTLSTDNSNLGNIYDSDNDATDNLSTIFVNDYLTEKRVGGMSSIAISTVDQLITASIPLKHNMLKWLAVSGKTLIFDEIHDFDKYTFGLICTLIEWCGKLNIPVIAMSATLSVESQKQLVKSYVKYLPEPSDRTRRLFKLKETNEIVQRIPEHGIKSPSWFSFNPQTKTSLLINVGVVDKSPAYMTTLNIGESFIDEVCRLSEVHLTHDANILVVANTVNQAILAFRELKHRFPDVDVNLLHSRMPESLKQSKIGDILTKTGKPTTGNNKKRQPQITVSTQLVQQSMDIDYDVLISALAPLPDLLQRVGRVHRHTQGDRRATFYNNSPYVHVLVENSIDAYSQDASLAINSQGSAPYSAWDIVISYITLKEFLAKNSSLVKLDDSNLGQGYAWETKQQISEIFELYHINETTYKQIPGYDILWKEVADLDQYKKDRQTDAAIQSPDAYADSLHQFNLTAPYTQRSAAAASTRLIEETVDIVFVKFEGDEYKLLVDSEPLRLVSLKFKQPLQRRKLFGQNAITLSKSQYKTFGLEEAKVTVPELESYSKYLTFINYEKISDNLKYDSKIEGLSLIDIKPSKMLWI